MGWGVLIVGVGFVVLGTLLHNDCQGIGQVFRLDRITILVKVSISLFQQRGIIAVLHPNRGLFSKIRTCGEMRLPAGGNRQGIRLSPDIHLL